MEYGTIYIVLAVVFGLFMAWGIGANDVANAMATSVGSKALTIKQAVMVAAVFELTGAILAGGEVTRTIRRGIIDVGPIVDTPELLIFGMLASLLAAGTWLLIATRFGWPVSTTHSIVGAIVGFAMIGIGLDAVHWGKLGSIAISWVASPLIAGTLAYAIFMSIQRVIINTDKPLDNAKRYAPIYIFLVGFMLSLITLLKGLKHVGLELSGMESIIYALAIGAFTSLIGFILVRRIKFDASADRDFHYANVEKIFAAMMIVTACSMAFAHGSNDVANAVGPLAAVLSIVGSGGKVAQESALPIWVLMIGGVGIVAGLAMYGKKVIATVGEGITNLTPSRGFSAELAAATTVVIASGTGVPISTTHTLVGAVLGVGLARGIAALNLRMINKIFMSWIITLPAGGILSVIFFLILKAIFE